MPKIRRRNLPPALLEHLLDRVQAREISPEQLGAPRMSDAAATERAAAKARRVGVIMTLSLLPESAHMMPTVAVKSFAARLQLPYSP